MSKRRDDEIRRKALRAITSVTAGAMLFAGVACSPDSTDQEPENNDTDPEWNLQDPDSGGDTSASDTAVSDTGADTSVADTGSDAPVIPDTAIPDTGTDAPVIPDTAIPDIGSDAPTVDIGTDAPVITDAPIFPDTAVADAGTDVGDRCNDQERTGECHEECTIDNDIDCCEDIEYGFGVWMEDGGCAVAVEGPFVPPRMPA